jgi:hypothetical protein
MSRVSPASNLPRFLEYRDAEGINDFFTDLEEQSGNIDWENFAEEGLDKTCFNDTVYGQRLKTVNDNTRIALPPTAGVFTTFEMGTPFRTSSIGLVNSNRLLRVLSVVYFESETPASHGIPVALLEMRHQYRFGGATSATLYSHAKKTGATIASGLESRRHATVAIESWIFGPIDDLEWVELAYELGGAVDAYPSKAFLLVDAFDGLVVL